VQEDKGIRRTPLRAKAVGIVVGDCFRDGIDRQQVERLHRAIFHRRDAQWARLAIRFRDIRAPQRAGLVASLSQPTYGRRFLCGRVPGHSVHARCPFALVFRHPSHGKGFAAERMGQQVLQGFDLAESAFLPRLHDTCLEATHVPLDLIPVDLMPVLVVGGRTSSRILDGLYRLGRSCRHLLASSVAYHVFS